MEQTKSYPPDYAVYPGEYVPFLEEEEIKEELKHEHDGTTILPPVNVTELATWFKVEVAVPGVKREEFLIYADGNILSISVMHKDYEIPQPEYFHLHEFNYHCFERHIILPKNVDAKFAHADYKEGILRMVLPKTEQTAKNQHSRIIVY